MEELILFITKYWLEFLFATFGGIMIAWCKKLQTKLKQKQKEQDALIEGVKAILHDMLFQICEKYLTLGYIPVDEADDVITRLDMVYNAYTALNGNGSGTTVYTNTKALPIKSNKSTKEEEE